MSFFYRNGYSSQITFRDPSFNGQNHQKMDVRIVFPYVAYFFILQMIIRANRRDNCNNLEVERLFNKCKCESDEIWVEKLGNTLFGVNSRIRTRDGICCQGILLPRFTGRFLDKNNEIISTTASFFFHYRPVWWTVFAWNFPLVQKENYALDFSEKSLCSGLVKILVSSKQLIFTRACYINYYDWLLSDIESVIVFHYSSKQGHLFSDPALYLFLFNKDCKSRFKARRNLFYKSPNRKPVTKYD